MAAISATTAAYYNSLSISQGSDWISSTAAAKRNALNSAGIIGALQNSGKGATIGSFLSSSAAFANNFATITQGAVTGAGSLFAQIASENQKKAAAEKTEEAIKALNEAQNKVKPTNVLDAFIYLGDGVVIDTANNTITRSDGSKYDIVTGAEVFDPAAIIQFGNGSYLNTETNILTLADGTKIDTVTGLQVS